MTRQTARAARHRFLLQSLKTALQIHQEKPIHTAHERLDLLSTPFRSPALVGGALTTEQKRDTLISLGYQPYLDIPMDALRDLHGLFCQQKAESRLSIWSHQHLHRQKTVHSAIGANTESFQFLITSQNTPELVITTHQDKPVWSAKILKKRHSLHPYHWSPETGMNNQAEALSALRKEAYNKGQSQAFETMLQQKIQEFQTSVADGQVGRGIGYFGGWGIGENRQDWQEMQKKLKTQNLVPLFTCSGAYLFGDGTHWFSLYGNPNEIAQNLNPTLYLMIKSN